MSSKEQNECDLMTTTTEAIHAYCRVLELHMKAIEQGANPIAEGRLKKIVDGATTGLEREVQFLNFLRTGGEAVAREKDFPGGM